MWCIQLCFYSLSDIFCVFRRYLNQIKITTTTTCYLGGDPHNSWQEHDEDSCSCLPESLAKRKGFSAGGGGATLGKIRIILLWCVEVARGHSPPCGENFLILMFKWNVLVTSSRLETNLIFF